MTDPHAERWFAEKRAEARRLHPAPFVIERRPIGADICPWCVDGGAATLIEAEEEVRVCRWLDQTKFGGESHEYRIVEQ